MNTKILSFLVFLLFFSSQLLAQEKFELLDVFDLEYVSDPQISPDGEHIVYVRNFKDIMTDGNRSNLWMIRFDGADNQPLTSGNDNNGSPRWSPDGKQLAYISSKDGSAQIYLRWLATGAETKLTNLTHSPGNIQWSPDGNWISMTMTVPAKSTPLVELPTKPEGAKWIDPPKYIDQLKYRSDGAGYLKKEFTHLFLLSKDGGHPRQLTTGDFNHNGDYCWTPDNKAILFSANRHDNWIYEPANSEIYRIDIGSGHLTALTSRKGPDNNPVISADGKWIAFTGYEDQYQGYQNPELNIMDANGKEVRRLAADLDRNINDLQWSGDKILFQYDDEGHSKIEVVDLNGKRQTVAKELGGLSLGRPYGGGSYSAARNGHIAFTITNPGHPADLATANINGTSGKQLTQLNDDLFKFKKLGEVEEFWYTSSFDQRKIQGWICKPPNFDPNKKYPLILEIHGGPFANYGWRFSAEVQLYAAAGYVVLYTNPRGSSSYGSEFGNLIHHNYPGQDYDDLISGVDAVISKGYIQEDHLYVTGGSGGGVLTAWIIGKTNRFRAAVVAKPVINWYSFVLNADNPAFFYRYWFPGYPWENVEHYHARSPISLVGNVNTPTLLLTGEEDYRTPISETEQYYAALQLRKVESAMVRIQGSGHGIANRPSNLINKVAYILGWFERYK
ncbi:MAG: acyl-peptide hydrolase [Saprospiraceae bacterium]|nr:MAG: acyl-peptide hydrolase [Saprospiraceae bacterium]